MSVPYSEAYDALADVYLEDSYVMTFEWSDTTMTFDLELVLCEQHAAYLGPKPNEAYDFRRARLDVTAEKVEVVPSGASPTEDPDGESDHGNIDSWLVHPDGWADLAGHWGAARLFRATVALTITEVRAA